MSYSDVPIWEKYTLTIEEATASRLNAGSLKKSLTPWM